MVKFKRLLKMDLPQGQSAFLWGARKTGKSFYLHQFFPTSRYINLLETDLYYRYLKAPHLLREDLASLTHQEKEHPVIIDEVQKIPILLNEVHSLIENQGIAFILCGSSARKLKRGAANLLGGRAWRYTFFPLVYPEIENYDLKRAMTHGLIPQHYLLEQPRRALKAYVQDYLKEEIQAEGLVRQLPAFNRFLEAMAYSAGGLLNYQNIARDCGVSGHTVREYCQILEDTLLAYFLPPYSKRVGREIIMASPKLYFFDLGVAHALKGSFGNLTPQDEGFAFEELILQELQAYLGLNDRDEKLAFWRTKSGLEVDIIVGEADLAIEIKSTTQVRLGELKGLLAFMEEHHPRRSIVVSREPYGRTLETPHGTIEILPWRTFMQNLWAHALLT
jgi:predicted AAA+ superfamily ATPase